MSTTHLRRNVVAYLALMVALSTGTAYAAGLANGSVTTDKLAKNAVTSPKIQKNAVTSSEVKNQSLKSTDLATGVVPGVAWVGGVTMLGDGTPVSSPDIGLEGPHSFTLPRAGTLQVSALFPEAFGVCPGGNFMLALYLDGVGIPDAQRELLTVQQTVDLLGIVPVAAGPHTVAVGGDCPTGSPSSYNMSNTSYSLVLGK